MHHEDWKRAYAEGKQLHLQAQENLKQAKQMRRMMYVSIVFLIAACTLVPFLQWVIGLFSSATLHVHTQ